MEVTKGHTRNLNNSSDTCNCVFWPTPSTLNISELPGCSGGRSKEAARTPGTDAARAFLSCPCTVTF